jgi:hypothetical protein
MTHELREELVKFIYDTPAYGAILLTKMANPEPHFYNPGEEWLYHHGWSIILLYRLYRMTIDMHKGMLETVLYYDDSLELVKMTGYQKLFQKFKNLFR